jgi:hypothetical protein
MTRRGSRIHGAGPTSPGQKKVDMTEYWFNVRTHEIEEDRLSDWSQLLGPYATRAEAEKALEKVQQRNDDWDRDDD